MIKVEDNFSDIVKRAGVHLIVSGDTIGSLAKEWGVTEEQVYDANSGKNLKERAKSLRIGESINRPEPATQSAKKINTLPLSEQIDSSAEMANVPVDLFRAMIRVESQNCTQNLSQAGAKGCGQLMPHIVDVFKIDPDDTAQNLMASATYLASLIARATGAGKEIYWNALMMYNWGEGNLRKWISEGMQVAHIPPEAKAHPKKVFDIMGEDVPAVYKYLYEDVLRSKKK